MIVSTIVCKVLDPLLLEAADVLLAALPMISLLPLTLMRRSVSCLTFVRLSLLLVANGAITVAIIELKGRRTSLMSLVDMTFMG